jgi:hypothetical protein
MSNNLAYPLFAIIGLITFVPTLILCFKAKRKKLFKYIPAMAVTVLGLLFCVFNTIFYYSSFIAIVYIGVAIIVAPGVFLSLLTAITSDLLNFLNKRKNSENI